MQRILLKQTILICLGLLVVLLCPPIRTAVGARVVHYPPSDSRAQKAYRVALVMVNTTGVSSDNPKTRHKMEFYSPDELGELFFNHPNGVRRFIEEASYPSSTVVKK